ncbi:MAG: MurR/RpiR family transcriptional regulator [Lachnospira sp.]|nr:MurR/RpiR family transcriptional regulator [Lachnospira sp.]
MEEQTDILSLIRKQMTHLSKGHKKIAEYILSNYEKCAFLTASKLGKAVGVSESTVVRFPAALGFSGYPEFQKHLENILQEKIHSFDKIDVLNSCMTTNMVVNNVMSMDARKIEHTLEHIDIKSFDLAVEDILGADNIYVIGVRACEPLAEFLGYYLRIVKKNVHVVKTGNVNELFEQMMHIDDKDVAIGISFPRYSMRTLKAMEFANNRKARVIAITDSVHSPMNMYSSCNLFARSDMASIVDSLVAPLSLINALIVSLCLKNSNEVVGNIEELGTVIDNFEYSGNDEINMLDEDVIMELKNMSDKV